jgi:hypothetical protein
MNGAESSYLYRAYGLNIKSALPLPDLVGTEFEHDVRITYGQVTGTPKLQSLQEFGQVFERPGFRIDVTKRAVCIRWDRVGTFIVEGGTEIVIEPDAGVSEADLQPFLTGPVLSVLLHQRGYFVLHASAVAIGDAAVAFLGTKGDGKSTLAAHLQVRGHRLIADDIVPVNVTNDGAVVAAGFPRIKLYDDSIMAVGAEPSNFPLIHSFVEKRSFQHPNTFAPEPVKLCALYVLGEGEEVRLNDLGHASAFIELTRHTFINRYLRAMDDESKHFQDCRELAMRLPVSMLERPRDFSFINEVCEIVEDHVRSLASSDASVVDRLF